MYPIVALLNPTTIHQLSDVKIYFPSENEIQKITRNKQPRFNLLEVSFSYIF